MMRGWRSNLRPIQLVLAVGSLLASYPVLAYEHPLSDASVRKAYFIGQDIRNASTFFAPYTKALAVPASGPQVAQIVLNTPYAQVVEDSAQHTVNYSAQDAATGYRKRGDSFEVLVKVFFTPNYANPQDDFWRSISVSLVQDGRRMTPISVRGEPIYGGDGLGPGGIIGANIFAHFSATRVSSRPVKVEVMPPAGGAVRATFDLSQLK